MNVDMIRTYARKGTNSDILIDGVLICHAIELPWNDNMARVSCIPEGDYDLTLYPSSKFGTCLVVTPVRNRTGILIHPANVALTELKGCIAPVSMLLGEGRGINSRTATDRLQGVCAGALNAGLKVNLRIRSTNPTYLQ